MLPDNFDPDGPVLEEDAGLYGIPIPPDEAAVVVIPVPWDATTSYGQGTARAPQRVLAASHQVDLHDVETGEPWESGIAMVPVDPPIAEWNLEARGNVELANTYGAAINEWVRDRTAAQFHRGAIPAVLGGEHSVPFGAIEAALERHPGMGLLHIDAHADLRDSYEGYTWSHASVLFNVFARLKPGPVVSVGLRDLGIREHARLDANPDHHGHLDVDLAMALAEGRPWADLCREMLAPLPDAVWVTVDVDGLDPAWCPGTGTPVPGGLSYRDLLVLLRLVATSGRRIVGFDVCETGPTEYDANVTARLLYKLAGWALKTR